jgi:hypothetical protein
LAAEQERRNFQVNPTKKNGVFPISNVVDGRIMTHAEEAARDAKEGYEPTEENSVWNETEARTDRTVARGPVKLNEVMITKFVESIRETGGPVEFHCQALGIAKSTYYQWRKEAQELPGSIYERFVKAVDEAIGERLKKLYVAAEHARPHEILFRQFPQLFPSDAVRLQLSGADGAPLFPGGENAFTVKLELHVPDKASAPEPEREFRIVPSDEREISEGSE